MVSIIDVDRIEFLSSVSYHDFFYFEYFRESKVGKGPKGTEGKTKPLLVTNPFVPYIYYFYPL